MFNIKFDYLKALPAVVVLVLLSACAVNTDLTDSIQFTVTSTAAAPEPATSPTITPRATEEPTPTLTETPLPTAAATPTATPTPTRVPTETLTPTTTLSPTPTLTPTYTFPSAVVLQQANCRYGPGTAYLFSHGLYQGDQAVIHGRNRYSTWVWIKPENLERHCWAAASVLNITGDITLLSVVNPPLPWTTFAGPPGNIKADRNGDTVTVSWDDVPLSVDKDRGYLLEATLCQNGSLIWMAVQTMQNSYSFTDQSGCSGASGALLYTAEKHGYSQPVNVPWP